MLQNNQAGVMVHRPSVDERSTNLTIPIFDYFTCQM